MAADLYTMIVQTYPALAISTGYDPFADGTVTLVDDGDGVQYIKEWNYEHPLPEGLVIGKPTS